MTLLLGDCIERLKELPDNSIDSVVTDPPYGLSAAKNSGKTSRGGFMGKAWDYDVPSVEVWREVIRVLKPGGHVLSFGGTRTYHRLVVNIEDAGFEVRDQVQWIYGSGFPKSLNLKGQWKGFGTALKPANEPIVVARKPLERGLTVAENVLKWGCGAINVDGCRIDATDQAALAKNWDRIQSTANESGKITREGGDLKAIDLRDRAPQGRWPANVIFDQTAAAMLDEQSGHLHAPGSTGGGKTFGSKTDQLAVASKTLSFKDSGGASRFFYVAKASKRERNAGLEGMPTVTYQSGMGGAMPIDDSGKERDRFQAQAQAQNHHPTVKPIKLMQYLVKLVTPPGGVVLDPFMGSGSTGCAALSLGFDFTGIEREQEYMEIAKRRIEHWSQEVDEPDSDVDQLEFPVESPLT